MRGTKKLTITEYRKRAKALTDAYWRLRAKEKSLKARCPHDWRYHPDPSGNNDSETRCDLCDIDARNVPTPTDERNET